MLTITLHSEIIRGVAHGTIKDAWIELWSAMCKADALPVALWQQWMVNRFLDGAIV